MDSILIQNAHELLRTALEKLESAKLLKNDRKYNDSLSRSYYAAFHAVSLLFMFEGQSFSKHSQLIGNFNKQYIATGILPKELGKALINLYDDRQSADYDFYLHATESEAQVGIENAEKIIITIKKYIQDRYKVELQ